MSNPRVLCYIVAYNAAAFIGKVITRIPDSCWHNDAYSFHVLISDDCSTDETLAVCERIVGQSPHNIRVQCTRHNLGYGGNQKLGYDLAIREHYDMVILLHGDGQYDPIFIPDLLAPLLAKQADVVLGSRMAHKKQALKGHMPFYKFIGNIVLTTFQNRMLGSALSEFHTGLRAYAVPALARILYRYNSDGYVFDTEILIQHLHAGHAIAEIPIATHYGEEICHVNGIKYARQVILATCAYKLHSLGFSYQRQYGDGEQKYMLKSEFASSHRFAMEQLKGAHIINIGGNNGYLAAMLRLSGNIVHGFDSRPADEKSAKNYDAYHQVDLETGNGFSCVGPKPDTVLLLDILEHLKEPERLLFQLRDIMDAQTKVIITVPNIAFFTIRLKLLFGSFSYSARGIMDHTHLRFYTFRSIKALLKQQGYAVLRVEGIPAPFPLVCRSKKLAAALLRLNEWLIRLHKGLFSFQIAIVAQPKVISHDH